MKAPKTKPVKPSKTRRAAGQAKPKTGVPREPANSAPETVLLAATGMSPAILTETIWALAHEAEPVIPSRVIAVTTSEGRARIQSGLLSPADDLGGLSPWDALRRALEELGHDLSGRLRFGVTGDDIRVITAVDAVGRSRELADLRTPAENEAAADFLLEQVRAIVENPDTRLVASIAGGRKTMGALLYACLSLVGRETDRLTHVLVSEPFETLPGFWFPGQPGGALGVRGQPATHRPADARLELADVPFVPLRNLFTRELGRRPGRFNVLVESCREQVRRAAGEGVQLTVRRSRCEIEINGTRLALAPREHLVLLFLATRAKQGEPAIGAYQDALELLNAFRESLRQSAPSGDFSDWRRGDSLKARIDDDQDLRKAVSGIRAKLRSAGGNAPLLAPCLPERGRFSLSVPGPMIFIPD